MPPKDPSSLQLAYHRFSSLILSGAISTYRVITSTIHQKYQNFSSAHGRSLHPWFPLHPGPSTSILNSCIGFFRPIWSLGSLTCKAASKFTCVQCHTYLKTISLEILQCPPLPQVSRSVYYFLHFILASLCTTMRSRNSSCSFATLHICLALTLPFVSNWLRASCITGSCFCCLRIKNASHLVSTLHLCLLWRPYSRIHSHLGLSHRLPHSDSYLVGHVSCSFYPVGGLWYANVPLTRESTSQMSSEGLFRLHPLDPK